MTLALKGLQSEFRPMFKLAWPVVLSEIGWMMMGVVDTIMVGRVSPEAIGGVSIGSVLHFTVAVLGRVRLEREPRTHVRSHGAPHLVVPPSFFTRILR